MFDLSCKECLQFHYEIPEATPQTRGGKKIPRDPGEMPPCHKCPKTDHVKTSSEASPFTAIEMSNKNRRAYIHYSECMAVAWQVPESNDPIVRRNARIILRVEEQISRAYQLPRLINGGN